MDITKYMNAAGEKPLDNIVEDGGLSAIFRTIAVIGDSLASGEHESNIPGEPKNHYHDYYEYSWGQYIARTIGAKVTNYSCGGMTAQHFWNNFSKWRKTWEPENICQAYIIALGCNDVNQCEMGSVEDIDLENPENNKETFCGYMGRIMQKIKEVQPKARVFLMTMPRTGYGDERYEREEKKENHAKLIYEIAKLFEFTYVIDLYRYAPIYDDEFNKRFYLGGHMNSMGYWLTAKMVMSYIDYIIRNNYEDFVQTAFIGTEFHNHNAKW